MSVTTAAPTPPAGQSDRYKWTALSNTTLGVFMASLDSSIVLISLPAIFRGIGLDPLQPSNISYLLWMLMGYLVVTAVLVVTFGRLGDMYGRVRMYNAGFAVFSGASLALVALPVDRVHGAMWLIAWRVVQGIGGALLMANSAAILTDAFKADQRGFAIGVSVIAGMAGAFIGLVVGGILADIDWRAVFWVNVPIGVFGTVWAYLKLREVGSRKKARIDWWGNITFGVGPRPGAHRPHLRSAAPRRRVDGLDRAVGAARAHRRRRPARPVLRDRDQGRRPDVQPGALQDPRVRGRQRRRAARRRSAAGACSSCSSSGSRASGCRCTATSFERTPLWAGIYMLPLTGGFLLAGPVCGWLSDRYGARWFTTGGMLIAAASFGLLMTLPTNFGFPVFGALLLMNGIGTGMFSAPNMTGIMNSAPPEQRGAASGMRATFQNTGMVLSIGVFFSLMIVGLSASLPARMASQLKANGVPAGHRRAHRGPPHGRQPLRRVPRLQPDGEAARRAPAHGGPSVLVPAPEGQGRAPHRQDVLPQPHLRPVQGRPDASRSPSR